VVDPDLLLRKTQAIEHHGDRLRAKLPIRAEALVRDESLRNDVFFDLIQAIQATMDLAIHACAARALGVPRGPAEALRLLAAAGLLDETTAENLARATGLRNLLVHQYGDVDVARVAAAVEPGLEDLDAFVRALRTTTAD
jgi:uncharacterized protein YutE (UPF0331/DUF86 family)